MRENIIQQFENEFLLLQVQHKSQIELHSCMNPAQFCSIPAGVPQNLLPSQRKPCNINFHPCGFHRIPAVPIPVQVSKRHRSFCTCDTRDDYIRSSYTRISGQTNVLRVLYSTDFSVLQHTSVEFYRGSQSVNGHFLTSQTAFLTPKQNSGSPESTDEL